MVFAELLSNNYGNEIYIKKFESLVGQKWFDVRQSFSESIPIGLITTDQAKSCQLNPKDDLVLEKNQFIVFIARSYESIIENKTNILKATPDQCEALKSNTDKTIKHILILGWSLKVSSLAIEVLEHDNVDTKIDIMSIVPSEEREHSLETSLGKDKSRNITHIDVDYSLSKDLKLLNLKKYDNIIFLANDWISNNIDADARSILGYLQLTQRASLDKTTPILIELADPESEALFNKKSGEIIISPYVISNLLANIALRPELSLVFDELFQAHGHDIKVIAPETLKLSESVTFNEIINQAYKKGLIAIGVMKGDYSKVFLNPSQTDIYDNIQNYQIIALH